MNLYQNPGVPPPPVWGHQPSRSIDLQRYEYRTPGTHESNGCHQPSGLDQIFDFQTSNLRVVGVGSDPDDLCCKSQFMGVQPHSLCKKNSFWGNREKVENCLFGPSVRASGGQHLVFEVPVIDSGLVGSTDFWEGYHESRRC